MDKPTKALAAGIIVAALICVVGYLASIYQTSQVASLVEKCKAEASQGPKGPWLEYQKAPLVCDPITLAELGVNNVVGIQKEIVTAYQDANRLFGSALSIATLVLALLAAPYVWYFLLRRIRELRDVIAGH